MKKVISVLFALVLTFSMSPASLAAPIQQDESLSEFSFEASLEDLQDGITFVISKNEDGGFVVRQILVEDAVAQNEEAVPFDVEAIPYYTPGDTAFHCGLTHLWDNGVAYLHWEAHGDQLTNVKAKVYCKDTSILFPKSYFNDYINEYDDLDGMYDNAYGQTEFFSIPDDVEKVKVGWSNVYITTVKDGKMSVPDASQTVKLKDY